MSEPKVFIMLKELDAQFKISKHIYAVDLFILFGFAGAGALLQNVVFGNLQIIFMIFNFLVGIFMTAPSFANPQKRNFQSVIILLRRTQNKRVYKPIPVEYSREDTIKLRKHYYTPSEKVLMEEKY